MQLGSAGSLISLNLTAVWVLVNTPTLLILGPSIRCRSTVLAVSCIAGLNEGKINQGSYALGWFKKQKFSQIIREQSLTVAP